MTTSTERNALLKLVARNARVAAADVDRLAAERYAEFERQAAKVWETQDLGVKEIVDELTAELAPRLSEIRKRVSERCDELGIEPEFRPIVEGGVRVSRRGSAFYEKDRRTELRRVAKAELEAARKSAKVEIERRRNEIEHDILVTGIESAQGRAILDRLPSAEQLMPVIDVSELQRRKSLL